MLRHNAGTAAKHLPGEKRADKGVTESDPGRSKSEVPAELTRVADKDNGREIGGTEGKGGKPRAYRAAAQHEAINVGGVPSAVKTYGDHKPEKADQHRYRNNSSC